MGFREEHEHTEKTANTELWVYNGKIATKVSKNLRKFDERGIFSGERRVSGAQEKLSNRFCIFLMGG
jgi:hypothetical protein